MSPKDSVYTATEAKSADQAGGFLRVLSMLFRRRRLIWTATLVTALIALGVSLFRRPFYESTIVIMPPAAQTGGLTAALGGALAGGALPLLSEGTLGIKNTGESYVSLLNSRTVEDAVIKRFNLMTEFKKKRMSDTRKVLEQRVTIFYGPRDGMIRLSFEAHDPNRAAELANGYIEEFKRFSATLAVTEASKRRQFYQQELSNAKDKLADAEVELSKSRDQTGILNIDAQARALVESAASLRGQISARELQIRSLEMYATDNNPALETARRVLAELRSQLALLDAQHEGASQDVILSKGKISEGSLDYVRRLRDVKYHETVFELLAREFESAQLDEARQGTTAQIVDKALPPDKKMPQYRALIVLVSGFFAFFATCLWLIVLDRWRASSYAASLKELRSEVAPNEV